MKYIVFFDDIVNQAQLRHYNPACADKAKYICEAINAAGTSVEVISPACTTASAGFFPKTQYRLNEQTTVTLPATRGFHTVFGKIVRRIWQLAVNYWFVFSSVKKGETVMAYHSVSLSLPLRLLKKLKHIKLILHVEEIYADVKNNRRYRQKEFKVFDQADGFIVPSVLLAQKINPQNKPVAVAHGCYRAIYDTAAKHTDGRIHCIYAGTFEETKGGAFNAIRSGAYLDEQYCIHILGSGSAQSIQKVHTCIEECSQNTACEIRYDGLKLGEEFREYVSRCHIGLSTQNPGDTYNDSSFPSKVLMYLSHGLAVVSVRIPVLSTSAVDQMVTYYEGQDPQQIADAIRRAAASLPVDYRPNMETLHEEFVKEIKRLLEEQEYA